VWGVGSNPNDGSVQSIQTIVHTWLPLTPVWLSRRGSRWNKFTVRCWCVGDGLSARDSRSNLKTDEQVPGKSGQTPRQEKRLHHSYTKHHLRLLISPVLCICEIKTKFKKKKLFWIHCWGKRFYWIWACHKILLFWYPWWVLKALFVYFSTFFTFEAKRDERFCIRIHLGIFLFNLIHVPRNHTHGAHKGLITASTWVMRYTWTCWAGRLEPRLHIDGELAPLQCGTPKHKRKSKKCLRRPGLWTCFVSYTVAYDLMDNKLKVKCILYHSLSPSS
jgi:hypothetical protein